jgi:hypothetical protein
MTPTRTHKAKTATAFAWASGLIEFTTPKRRPLVPKGAIGFASGPPRKLRFIIASIGRQGMGASAGKLLVPGIPEASAMGFDPVDCLGDFSKRVKSALAR